MRPGMALKFDGSLITVNGTGAVTESTKIGSTISPKRLSLRAIKPDQNPSRVTQIVGLLSKPNQGGQVQEICRTP